MIGSGPAGLAAAQQLTRAGHTVAVYERADKIGGLLRYGIPEFKMEKKHLDRRLDQMRREGTVFRAGVDVGERAHRRASCATGTTRSCWPWAPPTPRDLPVPGRELGGIHQAMEYLPQSNRASLGERGATTRSPPTGKHVVIIGGGDTGADCLGTVDPPGRARRSRSWRSCPSRPDDAAGRPAVADVPDDLPGLLGARGGRRPGLRRLDAGVPRRRVRPTCGRCGWSRSVFEGGRLVEVEGTEREIPAELVLLAMGFTGPETAGLVEQLGVDLDERGNVARDATYATSVDGVFVAGDAGRGQSLIVWAIAEGRAAAAAVDELPHRLHHAARPRSRRPRARSSVVTGSSGVVGTFQSR